MAASTENWSGRIALMVAHCAGMVDLVALPVWVGALIADYKFDPPHAGGLATLFLTGAVLSSLFFASQFNRMKRRPAAAIGFALAAAAFMMASRVADFGRWPRFISWWGLRPHAASASPTGRSRIAEIHTGCSRSSISRSACSRSFSGATPNLIAQFGGSTLFVVFAALMALAAIACALAFPAARTKNEEDILSEVGHIHSTVWYGVAGVSCMALTQAMMFSFLERIGLDRRYGARGGHGRADHAGLRESRARHPWRRSLKRNCRRARCLSPDQSCRR